MNRHLPVPMIFASVLCFCAAGAAPVFADPPPASAESAAVAPQPGEIAPSVASDTASQSNLVSYLLPDPAVGLDRLRRYTQSLEISFKGACEGRAYQTRSTDICEVWTNVPARINRTTSSATDEPDREVFSARIGNTLCYRSATNQPYQVHSAAPGPGDAAIEPCQLLSAVQTATQAGADAVAGIPARHYALGPESLGLPADKRMTGDLWVAADSGLVLKYAFRLQVDEGMAGKGSHGELTYDYALTKVNAADAPQLPAECPRVLSDFPVLPDASDIRRLPGFLDYNTSASAEKIATYYKEQLTAKGWEQMSIPEDATNAFWVFLDTRTQRSAMICVEAEGEGSRVTAQVGTIEKTTDALAPGPFGAPASPAAGQNGAPADQPPTPPSTPESLAQRPPVIADKPTPVPVPSTPAATPEIPAQHPPVIADRPAPIPAPPLPSAPESPAQRPPVVVKEPTPVVPVPPTPPPVPEILPQRPQAVEEPVSSGFPAGVPAYPGATDVNNMLPPGTPRMQGILFATADAPATVAKYYRDRLTVGGWTLAAQNEQNGMQCWSKPKQTLTLTCKFKGGRTAVTVLVTQEP